MIISHKKLGSLLLILIFTAQSYLKAVDNSLTLAQQAQIATALLRGPLVIAAKATSKKDSTKRIILSSLATSMRMSNSILAICNQTDDSAQRYLLPWLCHDLWKISSEWTAFLKKPSTENLAALPEQATADPAPQTQKEQGVSAICPFGETLVYLLIALAQESDVSKQSLDQALPLGRKVMHGIASLTRIVELMREPVDLPEKTKSLKEKALLSALLALNIGSTINDLYELDQYDLEYRSRRRAESDQWAREQERRRQEDRDQWAREQERRRQEDRDQWARNREERERRRREENRRRQESPAPDTGPHNAPPPRQRAATLNQRNAALTLLGLPVGTTDRETITRAYRQAAMAEHPDRNPDDIPGATARFQEIGNARDLLLN